MLSPPIGGGSSNVGSQMGSDNATRIPSSEENNHPVCKQLAVMSVDHVDIGLHVQSTSEHIFCSSVMLKITGIQTVVLCSVLISYCVTWVSTLPLDIHALMLIACPLYYSMDYFWFGAGFKARVLLPDMNHC